jgi:predicted TIM-barrel fold metal-dependent hydrolase
MEIIDAQVHLNQVGIEAGLAAMDAVGVDAVIVDQYPPTATRLSNGALRYSYDISEDAVRRFPARFAYVARIDPRDPEMERLMAALRSAPGRLGIRIDKPSPADLGAGRYDPLLGAAMRGRIPVWMVMPGRPAELAACAAAFPDLQLVIDHAGMPEDWNRREPDRFAPFDDLLALAARPNVAVKWGHMTKLSARPFPYDDVLLHLRRVVDAFGAERVMWESDWTMCLGHETLAQMLFAIRLSDRFDDEEKAWILGRTARTVMRWDRGDDRVETVAVGPEDWDTFTAALGGRLLHGKVKVLRLAEGAPPAGAARTISTVALSGAVRVNLAEAAEAALSGRSNAMIEPSRGGS